MLEKTLKLAHRLSYYAIWFAGFLTLLSAVYISIDIISRKLFDLPLGSSDELASYIFAIGISWSLSYATLNRANIRIDAIYQLLPTRIAAVLDWIALVSLTVFIVFLTLYATEVAGISWSYQSTANTILGTPLWIPQFVWSAGLVWLCIVLALMLVRSSVALITGNINILQNTCGMRSTKEEATNEAEAGKKLVLKEKNL